MRLAKVLETHCLLAKHCVAVVDCFAAMGFEAEDFAALALAASCISVSN